MARSVTLAALLATVRRRSDTQAQLLRHPDADVILDINDSWQQLREKVSEAGSGLYLVPTPIASLTPGMATATALGLAGVATNATFGTAAMPSKCARVFGFDLYVTSTDVRALRPVSFADRTIWTNTLGQALGTPQGFAVLNVGTESTTTVTPGLLALFPAPDKAYQYVLWYVPSWTNITNTTYVFDGIAGWDEWVAWDVTLKVRSRDGDLQGQAQIAMAERDRVWRDTILPACRFQRVAPSRRTDIAGQNRRNSLTAYRYR